MTNSFFTKPADTPSPSQPPTSRQKIIDYALRKLGAPVIQINVDDDQVEDRLDDALQLYREYHYDGVEKVYLKHEVTQADIDNEWVPAPDPIQSVTRMFVMDDLLVNNLFNFPFRFSLSQIGNLGGVGGPGGRVDLASIDITRRWLSLAQQMLNPEKSIRFNKVTNKIFVDMNWEVETAVGQFLLFELWTVVDPDAFTEVYNDIWLKEYFTALVKKQWASNLSKYEGIQLPGGVTWNGQQILDSANEEIEKLKEDLDLRYALPPDFLMG